MTDRELLEAAAKAAGIALEWPQDLGVADYLSPREKADWQIWNPLKNDGDALRLAVKLNMEVTVAPVGHSWADIGSGSALAKELHGGDPCAATRRAIVRAAAAMAVG